MVPCKKFNMGSSNQGTLDQTWFQGKKIFHLMQAHVQLVLLCPIET